MDNITHSLVGIIVGETVAAHTPSNGAGLAPRTRRDALVSVAVIGSNAPDIDLLVSYGGSGSGSIQYLLWHRGYTHTLIGCALLAVLLYGGAEAWMRWRRLTPSARDRLSLAATALIATGLHLAMDYLNSYGVHPFWPADDRWRYGDSVFIVEPLYWVAAAPLFFLLRSAVARWLFIAALLGVVALGLVAGMLSWGVCAILIGSTAALLALGRHVSARSATRASLALAAGVTLAFLAAGAAARREVQSAEQALFAHARTLDRVLTPAAANPLCWELWLLELEGDRYVARHASVALVPALEAAASCPSSRPTEHTAPWDTVGAPDSRNVHWLGEFSIARADIDRAVAADCRAQAFMQFARAPFLAPAGAETILGDLRFDRDRERGSFEVALEARSPRAISACPRAAPWIAPRADLLGADP